MKILLLLVCLVIQETIGGRLRRVIDGYDVDIEKVPHQVSIRYRGNHYCGGALISLRHVLTVAYCAIEYESPYNDITVVTGTNNLLDDGIHQNVKSIKCHDKFHQDPLANDIAVVTLKAKVQQSSKQKPIELPIRPLRSEVNGRMTGFGSLQTIGSTPSLILQSLKTKILPGTKCKVKFEQYTILEDNLCGWNKEGTRISFGDEGGVLVYNKRIVGLSSWTDTEKVGGPDIYVNVYEHLQFIKDAMKV